MAHVAWEGLYFYTLFSLLTPKPSQIASSALCFIKQAYSVSVTAM